MKSLKIILSGALLLGTAMAAQQPVSCTPNITGFNVVGSLGAVNGNVRYKETTLTNSTNLTAAQKLDQAAGQNAWYPSHKGGSDVRPALGLSLGYNHLFGGGAVLGADLFGDIENTKIDIIKDRSGMNNSFWDAKLRKRFGFGARVKAGYLITRNVLAYLGVGATYSRLKATITPTAASMQIPAGGGTANNGSNGFSSETSATSKSKNSLSLETSIGTDIFLNQNLFLKLEYSTNWLGKKINIDRNTKMWKNSKVPADSLRHTFRYTQQAFKLGIGWKF